MTEKRRRKKDILRKINSRILNTKFRKIQASIATQGSAVMMNELCDMNGRGGDKSENY